MQTFLSQCSYDTVLKIAVEIIGCFSHLHNYSQFRQLWLSFLSFSGNYEQLSFPSVCSQFYIMVDVIGMVLVLYKVLQYLLNFTLLYLDVLYYSIFVCGRLKHEEKKVVTSVNKSSISKFQQV